ncbi:MAG: glycoside hydrolase family 2 protein [Actinomycetota bacterium]
MDLGGQWRAHVSNPALAKQFTETAFDDSAWVDVTLPHHWRNEAAFAVEDGPLLYRHRFEHSPPSAGRRRFLELDGIFYFGDVWLDGDYVGATEGYFFAHAFEVTDALRAGPEHVLALEVACPPQRDRTAKRTITGVFGHWDACDPSYNPGGPWRAIRIVETGPVRIARARTVCTEASGDRGRLACDLTLDAVEGPLEVVLHATLTGPSGELFARDDYRSTLAAGENQQSVMLTVEDAPRWWPRRMGPQRLCTLTVAVDVAGAHSDERTMRTAFREVRADDWRFIINGERMFLKGTNLAPTRLAIGDATPAEIRRDLELAVDANLDFVRVHAHVARPELYDAADELGLLLWQDLPLQWGYAHAVRRQAVRQAHAMVDLLAHHPSVFLWCGHNAPFAADREPGEPWRRGALAKLAATTVLPTWSKQVLDRLIARAIRGADSTRPIVRHSGVLPGIAEPGTDTHLYYGWYHGELHGLAPQLRRWPRLARFVSEFGAQAVPSTADWMEPERWPDLDWQRLGRAHALQRDVFERRVPPSDAKSFDEWRDATQGYQAALVQLQIEDLRRLKYAPTGGFAQFSLADPHPAVSWSLLDHERVPKRAYAALRDACRPVLAMVEPRAGLVHVVNDTRDPLQGASVAVSVEGRVTRWTGDIPADGIAYVGTVDVADAVDVEVECSHPAIGRVVNRYPLLILRAP